MRQMHSASRQYHTINVSFLIKDLEIFKNEPKSHSLSDHLLITVNAVDFGLFFPISFYQCIVSNATLETWGGSKENELCIRGK